MNTKCARHARQVRQDFKMSVRGLLLNSHDWETIKLCNHFFVDRWTKCMTDYSCLAGHSCLKTCPPAQVLELKDFRKNFHTLCLVFIGTPTHTLHFFNPKEKTYFHKAKIRHESGLLEVLFHSHWSTLPSVGGSVFI